MGLLDVFRRTPRSEPAPPEAPPVPVEEQVRQAGELAVAVVAPGFVARDEAEQHLVELVADDPETFPDLDERRTRQIVAQVWRERLAIESTWTHEGDYPALRDAFADLEARGVVARMDFACCQTCGHAEIGAEAGPEHHGYTFFHHQDAARLAPGGGELYLAFGALGPRTGAEEGPEEGSQDSDALVGAEVARTLAEHGLVVDWDGSADTRIRLGRLDWRKRLPVA